MNKPAPILTTKLSGGFTVLAKSYKGTPMAKTYANLTQAQKAADAVGGEVIGRYPFYVLLEKFEREAED